MIDWDRYENFTEDEFKCSCGCGRADMRPEFMDAIQRVRREFGKPMKVNSGFRCKDHPEEKKKPKPGSHAQGRAADISMTKSHDRYYLKKAAYKYGLVGIGNAKTFIHLDMGHDYASRPAEWNYD